MFITIGNEIDLTTFRVFHFHRLAISNTTGYVIAFETFFDIALKSIKLNLQLNENVFPGIYFLIYWMVNRQNMLFESYLSNQTKQI